VKQGSRTYRKAPHRPSPRKAIPRPKPRRPLSRLNTSSFGQSVRLRPRSRRRPAPGRGRFTHPSSPESLERQRASTAAIVATFSTTSWPWEPQNHRRLRASGLLRESSSGFPQPSSQRFDATARGGGGGGGEGGGGGGGGRGGGGGGGGGSGGGGGGGGGRMSSSLNPRRSGRR